MSDNINIFFTEINSSIFSIILVFVTLHGISFTTITYCPCVFFSMNHLALNVKEPLPVSYAFEIVSGLSITIPPVAKSGP